MMALTLNAILGMAGTGPTFGANQTGFFAMVILFHVSIPLVHDSRTTRRWLQDSQSSDGKHHKGS